MISFICRVEELFAHEVENMLNHFKDPVRKQMAIEFLSVVATVVKRHPELQFRHVLNVQELIHTAVDLYKKDKNLGGKFQDAEDKFMRESVSLTSVFFAKSIIQCVVEDGLIGLIEKSSHSAHECPIQ